MKTVHDVLRRTPVWVNPEHTIETAIILMRGHDVGGLPVMCGGALVGLITYRHVLGADPKATVGDVMSPATEGLSPSASVREAAAAMALAKVDRMPVMDGGRLVGVVTHGDLVSELGRSFDPLTSLSWADSLREWAIGYLKTGLELTVLFIDLDDFGHFNKRYGHIVGDEVLVAVSHVLTSAIDTATDFACRYGGDEFCIATLRQANDGAALSTRVASRIADIRLESSPEIRVACTIGQSGGKRTREREHVHYAATLNSLINLASKECMRLKEREEGVEPPAAASPAARPTPRLQLQRVEVAWDGKHAGVHVNLSVDSAPSALDGSGRPMESSRAHFPASRTTQTDEDGILRVVAETTFDAVRGVLPIWYAVRLGEVRVSTMDSGQTLVTVVGDWISGGRHTAVAGSAVVLEDLYRTVAAATLASINRPLAHALSNPY